MIVTFSGREDVIGRMRMDWSHWPFFNKLSLNGSLGKVFDALAELGRRKLEAQDIEPNFKIGEANLTYNLSNNQLWPTEMYKVEKYLNDMPDCTLEFEVQ